MVADYTVAEGIKKMALANPKITSEEAAVMAVNLFTEIPMNHCCPSILETLQKAYDLPGEDFLPWGGVGLQGGMSIGTEVCGAISGAVISLGLWAYKTITPPTKDNRKLAAYAIMSWVWDLTYAFRATFGSVRCIDLSGWMMRPSHEMERHTRLRLWVPTCSRYVGWVARTMVEWGEYPPPPPQPIELTQLAELLKL